jgi:hypothetical protein
MWWIFFSKTTKKKEEDFFSENMATLSQKTLESMQPNIHIPFLISHILCEICTHKNYGWWDIAIKCEVVKLLDDLVS